MRASSRTVLATVADGLIDDKELARSHLGELNQIFERVQRWRKDKTNFSLEPDLREPFSALSREIKMVTENPTVLLELLPHRYGIRLDGGPDLGLAGEIYRAAAVRAFLRGVGYKFVEGSEDKPASLARRVEEHLKGLYKEFALKAGQQENLIDNFLSGLGIDFAVPIINVAARGFIPTRIEHVLVESFPGPPSSLVGATFSRGQLVLTYNPRHPWVEDSMNKGVDVEAFFKAVGYSILGSLGDLELVEGIFARLGIQLRNQIGSGRD